MIKPISFRTRVKKLVASSLLSLSVLAIAPAVRAQPYLPYATHGSGSSTITGLAENPDGTLTIDAVEEGSLKTFGAFTGSFHYIATIDPNTGTTFLDGQGVFNFSATDSLRLAVHIVETGADYPKPYFGVLSIVGGTGRFAKSTGALLISGTDVEDLTDGFQLDGVVTAKN